MRYVAAQLVLCACWMASGCATGLVGPVGSSNSLHSLAADESSSGPAVVVDDPIGRRPERQWRFVTLAENHAAAADEVEVDDEPDQPFADEQETNQEEIVTPKAADRPAVKPSAGEGDIDRFTRRVTEVPLDIRPTEGLMPDDLSAAAFSDQPVADAPGPSDGSEGVVVSYTPWTICYRALYFEDIELERYGCSYGLVQPAISGAHFFGTVAAMPYKMVVRPPRSCECSNGFSRCGDCPIDGYGERVWSAEAAAIEAGIVAGIVLALP